MTQEEPLGGINDWDDLKRAADANAGVYVTTMETLRDLKGAGRLGNLVREDISRILASRGMGHLPGELPAYQEQDVLIYSLGGDVGVLVRAVLFPSRESANALRNLNASAATDKLKKISAIINE